MLTHQDAESILMIGRTPVHSALLWHDGKAVEAVRPKRLSVTNFASGWILLIYVGKESQSAAISPEMPRQVNCILPLVTDSNTYSHTRACAHTHRGAHSAPPG